MRGKGWEVLALSEGRQMAYQGRGGNKGKEMRKWEKGMLGVGG
jgi:hypothetical protein